MAKLKRALATGLMAALLAFTLAGCAQSEQTPEGSANTGEASQAPAQQSNHRRHRDGDGSFARAPLHGRA